MTGVVMCWCLGIMSMSIVLPEALKRNGLFHYFLPDLWEHRPRLTLHGMSEFYIHTDDMTEVDIGLKNKVFRLIDIDSRPIQVIVVLVMNVEPNYPWTFPLRHIPRDIFSRPDNFPPHLGHFAFRLLKRQFENWH